MVCSDTICCVESTRAGDCKPGNVSRPIFKIKILGASGTALVDTGAKNCIAGHTLHTLLRHKGHPLHPARRCIKLADGHTRDVDVLMTTLDVHLEGKVIRTPFLILPESHDNETLVGMDFIFAADVVMDFPGKCWYFSETRHIEYPMHFEPSLSPQHACSSADVLKEDKGIVLTQPERDLSKQTLVDNEEVFRLGGEPTPYAEHRSDPGEHPHISVLPYRLTPARKKPKRDKCVSARGSVQYLGQQGISPNRDKVGDKVVVRTRAPSQVSKGLTAKFCPKQDGPYGITKKVSPNTFRIYPTGNPSDKLGRYNTQDLSSFMRRGTVRDVPPNPVLPTRRRGRPKRQGTGLVQERGRSPELEGEYVAIQTGPSISERRHTRVPARYLEYRLET
uniref:Peptidase A2 domain-containing protein n=1 Tax=Heliothis virescens TaxID=7102 RepID=A0A2A4IYB3_HELVI